MNILYQVGFEFHSNKDSVIKGLATLFDSLPKAVEELLKTGGSYDTIFHVAKRHPSIDIEAFKTLKVKFLQSIKEELDLQKSSHPDFSKEDTVLDRLTSLYEGKVGKPFSEELLEKIFKEGETRFAKEIPPGYKDLQTKKGLGNQRIYGDLIIWKQLIEYAKDKKKPIILITDDRKEDWWTKEGGETIRPRQELIKEFFDQTGIRILIYSSDRFLKFAKERRLIDEVTEASISEVRDVRKEDESRSIGSVTLDHAIYGTYLPNYKAYDPQSPFSVLGNPSYVSPFQVNNGLVYDSNGSMILNAPKPYQTVEDLIRTRYPIGVTLGEPTPTLQDKVGINSFVGVKGSSGLSDIGYKVSDLTTNDLSISVGKKQLSKGKDKK